MNSITELLVELGRKTVSTMFFSLMVLFVSLAATNASADVFVVNGLSSSISRLDPDTGSVLNTIPSPVPTSQLSDALAFSGKSLFYTNHTILEVYELDPDNGDVRNSFTIPANVGSLGFGRTAFGPTLFALHESAKEIHLLNPSTGDVFTSYALDPSIPCPLSIDVNTATATVFVGQDACFAPHLYELDATTGAALNSFYVPGVPLGIGFDGGRLFAVSPTVWPADPDITERIIEIDPSTGGILNSMASPDTWPSAMAGSPLPALDIKANGVDDILVVDAGTPVRVTVGLDPSDKDGEIRDWWIGALTPMGTYWYSPGLTWVQSQQPVSVGQIALFDLMDRPILDMGLPAGVYTFFFVIDDNADNVLDLSLHDLVNVIIQPDSSSTRPENQRNLELLLQGHAGLSTFLFEGRNTHQGRH